MDAIELREYCSTVAQELQMFFFSYYSALTPDPHTRQVKVFEA